MLMDVIKEKEAKFVFSKGELKIIEKQLLGINLTQSEKNRLSRSIRPKFEFIKKVSLFKDEFKLKKGGGVLKQADLLKDNFLLDPLGRRIKRIIIFGSFVKKEMFFDSDIDISVEFENITKKEATLFKLRNIVNKFDISVFNFLPDKIKEEINKDGKIIFPDKVFYFIK